MDGTRKENENLKEKGPYNQNPKEKAGILGHMMRNEGLESLKLTGCKGQRRRRATYLTSLCKWMAEQ